MDFDKFENFIDESIETILLAPEESGYLNLFNF